MTDAARPFPPRSARGWLLSAALAVIAALPLAVAAHQESAHAPAAKAAPAPAAEFAGRIVTVVVADTATGRIAGYPFLALADGTRYRLDNAGAVSDGAPVAVTGRLAGRTLVVERLRSTPPAGPAPKSTAARADLTGTLRVFHVDYPDGTSEFGYTLITDAGRQNVVDFGRPLPGIDNGARAKVSGPVDARGHVDVDTIELLPPAPVAAPPVSAATNVTPQAVTTGYTVIPLKYPNNTAAPFTYNTDPASWPIATINTTVLGAAPAQSVAEYYKEVSYGAQLVNGVVANDANTWLKANEARPTACSTNAQLDAVLNSIETQGNAAATAAGFNPASRPGILYVIDALPCGWAGLGYIGWERAYTKGTASLLVVGHELGHNFGLYHAGSLDCGANVIAPSGCTVTEYGDPFDIMGNNRPMHFAAHQKNILGYFAGNGSAIATHSSGSTTYTLGPIELAGQSRYAVKIPTSNTKRTYWIEFRQPLGFDSALSSYPNLGAQLRISSPFENNCSGCTGMYDDTQFLDMTPATSPFTDGALLAGQSFTDSSDAANPLTIDVLTATTTALSVKVTKGTVASATTTLASSVNPSTSGQSVTFTATVAGTAPTGTVAFKDGGTTLTGCSSVALSGSGNARTAACTTAALAVGVHSVVADYSGDAGNGASSSAALSQTVKAATTTTLASSLNPSTSGAAVTFTATVAGTAPTGPVAFTSDGAAIAGCTAVALSGNGNSRTAMCTTSVLAVGTRSIVAGYGGDGTNVASTSSTLAQVVTSVAPVATTTSVASSPNPAAAGVNVTFTASVTGIAPTGTVAFTADGATIAGCASVPLAGAGNTRSAACSTAALASGAHAIVATYGGNAGNLPSSSASLAQQITNPGQTATRTRVGSSNNPAPEGSTVTLTATISATPVAVGGAVSFTANGATLPGCASVPIAAAGGDAIAACSATLAPGAYSIVASYGGSATHFPSASLTYSQVVPFAAIGNTLQFAAAAYAVNEATGSVVLTVTRIGDPTAPAQVDYAMAGGSALANADFTPTSGTLAWPAHDGSARTIVVAVGNDGASESDETFTVTLANVQGATVGAIGAATVTIHDDESAPATMPAAATVVQNPYGVLAVQGGTLAGSAISSLTKNVVVQLGATAGAAGSFAQIDFQGLDVGAGNTLTIRSGAPGQTVVLVNAGAAAANVAGTVVAQGGNGAAAPALVVHSAAGFAVSPAGRIVGPAGLTLGTQGAATGNLVNLGTVDGGSALRIEAAKVNGGGAFRGDAMAFATPGNLNNPVNGGHFIANGLQLYPASGNTVRIALAGHGAAPQFVNLMVYGNATLAMPSAWPGGSTLPANNRPVLPGEVRAAGVPDPAYGGGSMIVQATGTFALDGGASGDFVFPGGIALIAGGAFDFKGTAIANGWTTSGTTYQGVFVEAPAIADSSGAGGIAVRTNHLNWVNFSTRPALPVAAWTLQRMGDGTAQFVNANGTAPHLNFYAIVGEAAAAGKCYTCLVNTQAINLAATP